MRGLYLNESACNAICFHLTLLGIYLLRVPVTMMIYDERFSLLMVDECGERKEEGWEKRRVLIMGESTRGGEGRKVR
jgi:hypothetical protein